MRKFRESRSGATSGQLVAGRYALERRLGRGSFGTVFLIRDTKTETGEKLKVLKEIPVGELRPDETVTATQEAQLLSQLHHPYILKFHTSFLERDVFCIITEYCEDRDLECKLEELRLERKTLSERQITEWLVQLLLGVDYMHRRRILHRDLKSKNVFLKRNMVKIGDFGVSCLLMGSCDLATTFTGTPYYMSPEALSHRGYDSKSDIWSLGCILYEMCCLKHAFEGHNFLSVVVKIVESSSPTLPQTYSPQLNSLMQSMLQKDPVCRISTADALNDSFLKDVVQTMKQQCVEVSGKELGDEGDAAQIARALRRKVHMQTLRARSEVEKMSPRERMRLRKLQAADERGQKLKQIVEEKYQENQHRMMELRSRHFQNSVNVLNEKGEESVDENQPISSQKLTASSHNGPMGEWLADLPHSAVETEGVSEIPEDPRAAEHYYSEEDFESCSDEDDLWLTPPSSDRLQHTFDQSSDLEAMVKHMENVLSDQSDTVESRNGESLSGVQSVSRFNSTMVENRIQHMRESLSSRLGEQAFCRLYHYLKETRQGDKGEDGIVVALEQLGLTPVDGFEVDQLLYYEEQLQVAQHLDDTNTHTLAKMNHNN